MLINSALGRQYAAALAAGRAVLGRLGDDDLRRPTPCRGWDLRTLGGHMVGQNRGFATAIATGDAGVGAYAPHSVSDGADLLRAWDRSEAQLLDACAAVEPDRPVRLVEIAPASPVPAATAVRVQLLDTVVHTWDVAVAIGRQHRPSADLLEIVAATAERVPDGGARTLPGAAFAPAVTTAEVDPWRVALARLGRDPGAHPALGGGA